jgi:hypothetical protein
MQFFAQKGNSLDNILFEKLNFFLKIGKTFAETFDEKFLNRI